MLGSLSFLKLSRCFEARNRSFACYYLSQWCLVKRSLGSQVDVALGWLGTSAMVEGTWLCHLYQWPYLIRCSKSSEFY